MINTYQYQRYMKINITATITMATTTPIIMPIGEESDFSSGAA